MHYPRIGKRQDLLQRQDALSIYPGTVVRSDWLVDYDTGSLYSWYILRIHTNISPVVRQGTNRNMMEECTPKLMQDTYIFGLMSTI